MKTIEPSAILYEHADGRRAVVSVARLATFAIDNPDWHRAGPVEIVIVDGAAEPIVEAQNAKADTAVALSCRDLSDEDMDALATWIGQQERGEIGFAGLAEKIIRAFASPITASEPGWTKAGDALPPCRDEQLFIGVNSAGFAGVFNAVADVAGDVHCMYETAEESIDVFSDLAIWRPFNPPSLVHGLEPRPEHDAPVIRVTRVELTPEQADGLRVKNAVSIPGATGSAARTMDGADADRLEWMLRRVSGSWLRSHLGAVGDTGDMAVLRVLIDANRQAPPHSDAAQMPVLPDWLLNTIGEYGMARTDRVSELEIQHRWELLIRDIKRYAAACVSATALQQPEEAKK